MSNSMLNIAEICPRTRTLGPGLRFAVWVQGCPFNCKGCVSQDWIPFRIAYPTTIKQLAHRILADAELDGVSISGGEPFMQAGRLAKLLAEVKKDRTNMTAIVFTGFRLEQLDWKEARQLLAVTDVLVSGLYVEKLNDNRGLRGSSNQRIHYLTDALVEHRNYFEHRKRDLEFHVSDDGVLMSGIPEKDFTW